MFVCSPAFQYGKYKSKKGVPESPESSPEVDDSCNIPTLSTILSQVGVLQNLMSMCLGMLRCCVCGYVLVFICVYVCVCVCVRARARLYLRLCMRVHLCTCARVRRTS